MIKIKEQIYIKSDINKIWAYLIDFSQSLSFNRFHTQLELPAHYSLANLEAFQINHNFGFGNYKMVAEIKESTPPNRLRINEYCPEDPNKGFPHTIEFIIDQGIGNCKLNVSIEAQSSFGWERFTGTKGLSISIDSFGKSGRYSDIQTNFGFNEDQITEKINKKITFVEAT